MPSSSKIVALSLIAGASAAPLNLFGGSQAKATASVRAGATAKVTGDLTTFADSLVSSATGGAISAVSKVADQLTGTVGLTRAVAANTWASGQCLLHYADIGMCTELGAYLSAVNFAFEQGWSAAQLFAALGQDRVAKFQQLLTQLCAHAEASSTCSPLLAAWPTYVSGMVTVDASIAATAAQQLAANGIIALIDAAHAGTSIVSSLTQGVMANVNAAAGATTKGSLGINLGGLHLRGHEEHADKRFLGLENLFGGHKTVTVAASASATAAAAATATANAQAQAQAAGALNIANIINAAGSLSAGAAAQAGAGVNAGASAGLVSGLTAGIPLVGGLVNGLPIVGGLTHTVDGVVSNLPVVGAVANTAAGVIGQATGALGAVTNIAGQVGVPGLLSLGGQVSGAANANANAAAAAAGTLGSATHLLGLRDISSEIAEGDVFADEQKRDLLSGLLGGSGAGGLLNGLPIVGGLANGVLSNPTGLVNGVLSNPTGLLNGLPVVGGLVNGVVHNPTGALNGLPVVGNTVNGLLNTVTHLPVVGDAVNGVLNTASHLPIVGNVAAQATGALSSTTNAGLNIGKDGLNLGLSDVTKAAGGLAGAADLHLKRGLLDGLPLLGALPVSGIVNSLPIVNNLPVGSLLSNPVGTVQGVVKGLPIVGGLVHGLTSNLPIVGGLTAGASAQAGAASQTNAGLNLGAGGISASLNDVTHAVGSLTGGAGIHLGQRGLLDGLLGGNSQQQQQGLPLVGNLPIVGGLVNGLTSSLPIVGSAGNLVNGLAGTVGQVTGTVGNVVNGVTGNLPIVGPLVNGLTHSLPLIGASASAAAQGQASTNNNLGLNLGAGGLGATLNSVTSAAGGLLGGANLHLKKSIISDLPVVGGVASHLPIINNLPVVGNGQVKLADGLNVQLGPVEAQIAAALQASGHSLNTAVGAGLKVSDILSASSQGLLGALFH
ncbi:hypothetical protein IAT40_001140 [Kwoniella sp. CBS 6097]